MFDTILAVLSRISRWSVLWLLLAVYLVFVVLLMPMLGTLPGIPKDATPPLDLLFAYSPQTAFAHVESLGEAGRKLSIWMHLTLDVAYPIVYSILMAVILTMTLRYVMGSEVWRQRTRYLPLVPFAILDFDLLENFGISYLMLAWPQQPQTIAKLTSFATSAKWSFVIIVLSLILGLLILALIKRVQTKH